MAMVKEGLNYQNVSFWLFFQSEILLKGPV